jgi:hypothetical protein
MMYCSNCGAQQNNPNGVYCYNCGAKLGGGQSTAVERPVPVKKRIALSKKGEAVRSQLIKEGVSAALFVGGVTALLATLSLFNISVLGVTPWSFVDAGIFFILAYGVYRGNKYAGVSAFTFYIAEALYGAAVVGQSGTAAGAALVGDVVKIVLIRAFYRGMKGTLAYTEGYSFATYSGKKLKPLTWLTIACVVVGTIGGIVL